MWKFLLAILPRASPRLGDRHPALPSLPSYRGRTVRFFPNFCAFEAKRDIDALKRFAGPSMVTCGVLEPSFGGICAEESASEDGGAAFNIVRFKRSVTVRSLADML